MGFPSNSFVEVGLSWERPAEELFRFEPVGDFTVGGFNRVGAVANVAAGLEAEVATDGSWGRVLRVGGSQKSTALSDGSQTFKDDGEDWSGGHVLNQPVEERLVFQVAVVLLEVLLGGNEGLGGNNLESSLLKTGKNLSDQAAGNTIGLDGDEGTFGGGHC